jgi:pilus assembly protein FimV
MDFTLDFDSPGGDGPPPTLPDLALDLGASMPQADLDIDPAHTRPLGSLADPVVDPMAPGIDLSATNVFLDAGVGTASSIEFPLDDGKAASPDTAGLSASLQDTMILQNPGELVSFDMTNPAGLPGNWQDSTLPRVDLNLADAAGGPHDERWNDVNTKYDLAKAYEEMGDKDGAREILREVIAEGDAQQRADAEAMLARLG